MVLILLSAMFFLPLSRLQAVRPGLRWEAHGNNQQRGSAKEFRFCAGVALSRFGQTVAVEAARAKATALHSPEELLNAIRSGDASLRLKLKSEIAKRTARIEITFNATVLTDGPVDVEPGTGRTVAKVSFIN